jgi:hypothetical protein
MRKQLWEALAYLGRWQGVRAIESMLSLIVNTRCSWQGSIDIRAISAAHELASITTSARLA